MYNQTTVLYKHGDVVKTGSGTFYCSSFEDIPPAPIDFVFTDPPWNDGILRRFYEYADVEKTLSFESLLRKAMHYISRCSPKFGFVMMGMKKANFTMDCMTDAGLHISAVIPWQYSSPATELACIVFGERLINVPANLTGFTGPQAVADLLANKGLKGKILDPFAGEGSCFLPAIRHKFEIIGIELIPAKFQSLISKVEKEETKWLRTL